MNVCRAASPVRTVRVNLVRSRPVGLGSASRRSCAVRASRISLGTSGGSRGVKKGGEVIDGAVDRREGLWEFDGAFCKAASSEGIQCFELGAMVLTDGLQTLLALGITDDQLGLGISDEVVHFSRCVARIQRHHH